MHGLVWSGAPAANDAQISEASVVLQCECASNHMRRLDPAPDIAKGRSCPHCPKLLHISGQEQTTTPLARKVRWPDTGLPDPKPRMPTTRSTCTFNVPRSPLSASLTEAPEIILACARLA